MGNLTPKEKLFCEYYTNIDSDTFSKKKESADRAGYDSPKQCYKLLKKANVQAEINKLFKANEIGVGRVMAELEALLNRCKKAGDKSNAVACLKLMGQRFGLFTERVINIDSDRMVELNEAERIASKKIAAAMINEAIDKAPAKPVRANTQPGGLQTDYVSEIDAIGEQVDMNHVDPEDPDCKQFAAGFKPHAPSIEEQCKYKPQHLGEANIKSQIERMDARFGKGKRRDEADNTGAGS